jgi:hypothetical protein
LSGPGLPAALVLAIMILPTIAAVSQDALTAVPMKTKQAAYGMGTTHWEAILKVMVPSAATGIFGSLVLGWAGRWVKPWPWQCWWATPTTFHCRCLRRPIPGRLAGAELPLKPGPTRSKC